MVAPSTIVDQIADSFDTSRLPSFINSQLFNDLLGARLWQMACPFHLCLGTDVMLRITVSNEPGKLRMTVEGELSGDLAQVLEENWNQATVDRSHKIALVDLRNVTFIDVRGKAVLRLMLEEGAEVIVGGPSTAHIIETLRAENKAGSRGARK